MVKVVVCICTCRRPDGIRHILSELLNVEFDGELSVVVVDNDVNRAGLGVVASLKPDYPLQLEAGYEPQPGIPFARNHALKLALAQKPDFVAMLDDDEWPAPFWLRELLQVMYDSGVDVVGGPVLPVFPNNNPVPWYEVAKNYYGADQGLKNGERCRLWASGNFIAKTNCFRQLMPTPFNPNYSIAGGEDTAFFHVLEDNGCMMAWSQKGQVYETVPPQRMSMAWLKERVISDGNMNIIVQKEAAPGVNAGIVRGIKTMGLFALGAIGYVTHFASETGRLRGKLKLWKAWGRIIGHWGTQKPYHGHGG